MPTLREQIALKRAEARSNSPAKSRPGTPARAATPVRANSPFGTPARTPARSGSPFGGFGGTPGGTPGGLGAADDVLEDKNVRGQIAKARRTGKLDLALLELAQLPHELYTDLLGLPESELSNPPPAAPKADSGVRSPGAGVEDSFARLGFGGDEDDEDSRSIVFNQARPAGRWVEPEELTLFKANGNRLRELDLEVGLFGGLKTLDLHANQLSALPKAVADLLQLTRIDLSENKFTDIPAAIQLLPALESVNLSRNAVAAIDLTRPVKPSEEGMAYGTGFLVSAFERARNQPKAAFPALRVLNLAQNALTVDALAGLGGREPLKLRVLTLSQNQLEGAIDASLSVGAARMPELQSLVLAGNRALDAVDGELAPGCAVDMEGCSCGNVGAAAPGGSLAGARSPTKQPSAEPEETYRPAPGGPNDTPDPSVTVTFVQHPAATFDGEPLPVQMDVYLPPSDAPVPKAGHPVVIWWHGGGLLQGNKENLPPHLRRLPSRPLGVNADHCVVISPNYRLAPQAPILDVLADVDAAIGYTRAKLNAKLEALGHGARVDPARVVLSGGSAGGYLALMAGLPVPKRATDAEVGGYRGAAAASPGWAPRGIAAFYPITDLTHPFWSTETDPVPWWGSSVPDSAAQPHLNPRDAPVASAASGGPRSILYPYMLQHGLFPRLLFLNQRSRGHGLDGYRPSPETLSVTHRLRALKGEPRCPVYVVYGTRDDKIQPLEESVEIIKESGETSVEVIPGADHAYDEDPEEQAAGFVRWLETVL